MTKQPSPRRRAMMARLQVMREAIAFRDARLAELRSAPPSPARAEAVRRQRGAGNAPDGWTPPLDECQRVSLRWLYEEDAS